MGGSQVVNTAADMFPRPSKNVPKIVVFASGTKDGGGSGFEHLVKASREGKLHADIVAVVSNHANGGVKERATRLDVPFVLMSAPFDAAAYSTIVKRHKADLVVLSGWLKFVAMKRYPLDDIGLDPAKTINIHPGPLPRYGGKGMYGIYVHVAVEQDYRNGITSTTGPTMHFVTAKYDEGPVIFHKSTPIEPDDTPQTIQGKVHAIEQAYQWWVVDLVARGEISWDGVSPSSLRVPPNYKFMPVVAESHPV